MHVIKTSFAGKIYTKLLTLSRELRLNSCSTELNEKDLVYDEFTSKSYFPFHAHKIATVKSLSFSVICEYYTGIIVGNNNIVHCNCNAELKVWQDVLLII